MRLHRHMRGVVGLLAAYGLVVQAFVLALALGASAASSAAPILCMPSRVVAGDSGEPSNGAAHLPDCCVVGNCGVAGALNGSPAPSTAAPVAFVPADYGRAGRADAPRGSRLGAWQARAPPVA